MMRRWEAGPARRCAVCFAVLLAVAATAALAVGDELGSRNGQSLVSSLTGRVVTLDGKPLSGVKIWTPQTDEEEHRGEPQPLAISGPDGTFAIPNIKPFPFLAVCPSGWLYEGKQLLGHPPFQPLELRLRPATRISGRVVDKRGEPVAGLPVWAMLEGRSGGCIRRGAIPPCENSYEPRSGATDAEGRFVFEALESGWWEISVLKEDERQTVRRRAAADRGVEGIEFVLAQKSVPVEGRIVDTDSLPVVGAQVTLSGARREDSTETDAAGEFRILGALSGRNHLRIEHPDQGWIEQDVEIEDRPVRLELRMPPVTLVQGRILGPDGAPVKKVFLSIGEEYIEVAPDGTFRSVLPPGDHEIDGFSFEPRSRTREQLTARGEPIDLELRLARPGTIQVRLTGLPSEEEGQLDLRDRPEHLSFDSEKDLYRIEGVPPGQWILVASDANGRTFERRVDVTEGEMTTLDEIHFPPLPKVRGRVLDPSGRPSAGTEVIFVQNDREIWAETDIKGNFVTWLQEGSWTIRAEREGFGPAILAVEVPGDTPMELPELRLARLVAVSGRVLGLTPEAVVPWVQAQSEDGLPGGSSEVDQENRFHLPDLWPGTWTLSTDIDGRPVSTTLQIPPDATEVKADLDCSREMAGGNQIGGPP